MSGEAVDDGVQLAIAPYTTVVRGVDEALHGDAWTVVGDLSQHEADAVALWDRLADGGAADGVAL